jgi:hypothetical protein
MDMDKKFMDKKYICIPYRQMKIDKNLLNLLTSALSYLYCML